MYRIITSTIFTLVFTFFVLPSETYGANLYSQQNTQYNLDTGVVTYQVEFTATATGTLSYLRMKVAEGTGAAYPLRQLRFMIDDQGGGLSCDTSNELSFNGTAVSGTLTEYNIPFSELGCTGATNIYGGHTYDLNVVGFNASATANTYIALRSIDSDVNNVAFVLYDEQGFIETECVTCTRIVDIIAPTPEYVYFITPDASYEYYVNSADVINNNNVYIEFLYNSVKSVAYAQTDSTNYSGGIDENITIFDTSYFFNSAISELSATGTYAVSVQIYERIYPPWWQFWDNSFTKKTLTKEEYRFHIYSETDAQEIAQLYETEQAKIEQSITPCFDSYTSNDCLKSRFEELVNAVIYAPPLGYGSYLVHMLISTTSSSTAIEMTLTFSSTSPAYGSSLNLDASTGLAEAIASIRAMDIPTMDNNPFDQFMIYWNRIWYILLAFYILRRIYGTFDINFSAGNYQKSGDIKTGYRKDNEIRIKSYD